MYVCDPPRKSRFPNHTEILATCLGLKVFFVIEAFCILMYFLFRKNRLSTSYIPTIEKYINKKKNIWNKQTFAIWMCIKNYLNDCLYVSNGLHKWHFFLSFWTQYKLERKKLRICHCFYCEIFSISIFN